MGDYQFNPPKNNTSGPIDAPGTWLGGPSGPPPRTGNQPILTPSGGVRQPLPPVATPSAPMPSRPPVQYGGPPQPAGGGGVDYPPPGTGGVKPPPGTTTQYPDVPARQPLPPVTQPGGQLPSRPPVQYQNPGPPTDPGSQNPEPGTPSNGGTVTMPGFGPGGSSGPLYPPGGGFAPPGQSGPVAPTPKPIPIPKPPISTSPASAQGKKPPKPVGPPLPKKKYYGSSQF